MEPSNNENDFYVSTDNSKLQIEVIHGFLSQSYWANGIPIERVKKSIDGSMCFGVYKNNKQIGFARVITDGATMAYLADVFILESHRGLGLSKLLMETIMQHAELQGLRKWMLATKDAHGLYKQFGFTSLAKPERMMEITKIDLYL